MTSSFVNALADAIVGRLLTQASAATSPIAPRVTRRSAAAPARARRGGRPLSPLADLDPVAFERVASAIAAQLAGLESQQELPLDRIEI